MGLSVEAGTADVEVGAARDHDEVGGESIVAGTASGGELKIAPFININRESPPSFPLAATPHPTRPHLTAPRSDTTASELTPTLLSFLESIMIETK